MLNLKPFFAILGGFLIHLTLGAVYSWGNLSLYVISYIRNNGSPVFIHIYYIKIVNW